MIFLAGLVEIGNSPSALQAVQRASEFGATYLNFEPREYRMIIPQEKSTFCE